MLGALNKRQASATRPGPNRRPGHTSFFFSNARKGTDPTLLRSLLRRTRQCVVRGRVSALPFDPRATLQGLPALLGYSDHDIRCRPRDGQ